MICGLVCAKAVSGNAQPGNPASQTINLEIVIDLYIFVQLVVESELDAIDPTR
jgi:hypothetical protein